ncbi:MAG TPA: hypothetical protein DD636_09585 [Anaerolineaceae bacterium]|jgi:hypothetical protein|nr:hypothetical protein [Anaerolineaceae bacterium]
MQYEYPPILFPNQSWLNQYSSQDAKKWFEYYISKIPERLQVLHEHINATPGYETWKLGFESSTVNAIEQWFIEHVEMRDKTKEEIERDRDRIPDKLKNAVPVETTTLSNKTYSLIVDLSMYYGEYLRHEDPRLKWVLRKKGKREFFYQNPVIVGTGLLALDPRHIMTVIAFKISDNEYKAGGLIELKDRWIRNLWLEKNQPLEGLEKRLK